MTTQRLIYALLEFEWSGGGIFGGERMPLRWFGPIRLEEPTCRDTKSNYGFHSTSNFEECTLKRRQFGVPRWAINSGCGNGICSRVRAGQAISHVGFHGYGQAGAECTERRLGVSPAPAGRCWRRANRQPRPPQMVATRPAEERCRCIMRGDRKAAGCPS